MRGLGLVTPWPSISTAPEVGGISPAIGDSKVLLPQPLCPIRLTNSPGASVNDTVDSASVSPAVVKYDRQTSRSSIFAVATAGFRLWTAAPITAPSWQSRPPPRLHT
ncbi:hypothetical protein G6F46_015149 [Rhizopus delemar]|nr:hypothetical protein G6F46_015149 [Rhizopus delemar]